MREYLNLKGQKIGWLDVLELSNKKEINGTTKLWKCKCECGKIVFKTAGKLSHAKKVGYNLSCGCSKAKENLIGKIYNDFKILEYIKDLPRGNRLWKCQCLKCGKKFELTTFQFKKNINICQNELKQKKKIEHKLHDCFLRIKRRCYNKNHKNYKYYGGRGITICDEWLMDSNNFVKWALENGWNETLTIDRIDNEKGYSPENCRWSTKLQQANNKRNNIFFEYNGKTQTLAQWCRELNLNYKYVHYLIKNKNKSFKEAIKYKKRG